MIYHIFSIYIYKKKRLRIMCTEKLTPCWPQSQYIDFVNLKLGLGEGREAK